MLYSMKPAPQPQSNSGQPNSRGLEDDEELLQRDLDAEELFGREYDLFDERDIVDDIYFERDLDAEELFGREYDLFEERDYIVDDLD